MYIVVWATHDTDAADDIRSLAVGRLGGGDTTPSTKAFGTAAEALDAARENREAFMAEERRLHGGEEEIELFESGLWLLAKSVDTIATWAVVEI